MRSHYNVAPRYTPGSPGIVSEAIAEDVAKNERQVHAWALEGRYGEAERERARSLGLAGIVELRSEGKKGWDVLDVITGERFVRSFDRRMKR